MPAITTRTTTTTMARIFSIRGPRGYYLTVELSIRNAGRLCQPFRQAHLPKTNSAQSQIQFALRGQGYRCCDFRRLDRRAKRGPERPSLNNKRLIVERRSLHAALRALVETTRSRPMR